MKRVIIVGLALMTVFQSYAGTASVVVVAAPGPCPVAASITKKADFVACPVLLSSEKKEPVERFADLQLIKDRILKAAEQDDQIMIESGPVSLSGDTPSFLLSKLSTGSDPYAAVQLRILVPVSAENPDVFAGGQTIKQFLASIKLPEKMRCSLGQIQLALNNPEQYRDDILKEMAAHITRVKSILEPTGAIEVTGLANPVQLCQTDDENLALFIPYSLSLSSQAD